MNPMAIRTTHQDPTGTVVLHRHPEHIGLNNPNLLPSAVHNECERAPHWQFDFTLVIEEKARMRPSTRACNQF
jgi:hypothetical protein